MAGGTGRTTPDVTQRVLCPRHFMAEMPRAQRTPPASSVPSGAVGAWEGQSWRGLPCWQHGNGQSLVPVQGASTGVEQQQLPLRHTSALAQPQAAPPHGEAAPAGMGTPNAVSR